LRRISAAKRYDGARTFEGLPTPAECLDAARNPADQRFVDYNQAGFELGIAKPSRTMSTIRGSMDARSYGR